MHCGWYLITHSLVTYLTAEWKNAIAIASSFNRPRRRIQRSYVFETSVVFAIVVAGLAFVVLVLLVRIVILVLFVLVLVFSVVLRLVLFVMFRAIAFSVAASAQSDYLLHSQHGHDCAATI